MKLKTDFVTNSSSTAFIIEVDNKVLRKDIERHFKFKRMENFRYFDNLKRIISYAQQAPCDWISIARGIPKEYYYLAEHEFMECRNIIEDGKSVVYVVMDRDDWQRKNKLLKVIEKYANCKLKREVCH